MNTSRKFWRNFEELWRKFWINSRKLRRHTETIFNYYCCQDYEEVFKKFSWNFYEIVKKIRRNLTETWKKYRKYFVRIFKTFDGNFVIFSSQFLRTKEQLVKKYTIILRKFWKHGKETLWKYPILGEETAEKLWRNFRRIQRNSKVGNCKEIFKIFNLNIKQILYYFWINFKSIVEFWWSSSRNYFRCLKIIIYLQNFAKRSGKCWNHFEKRNIKGILEN